jgi:hypothetical protein
MCPTTSATKFAQTAYQTISGCTNRPLPVDPDCGHLLEDCLTDEMMTPTLWEDGTNVFSRITIGWLQDLGYDVDYSLANAFDRNRLGTIPGCRCNRRLGEHDNNNEESSSSVSAGASRLDDNDAYDRASASARQFFYARNQSEQNQHPATDGKNKRERALAITVLEQGRPYLIIVRD